MIGYGDEKIILMHGFDLSLNMWDEVKELFTILFI